MKKLFYLFGIIAFASCQENWDESNVSTKTDNVSMKTSYLTITPEEAIMQAQAFRADILSSSGSTTRTGKASKSISSVYAWRSSEITNGAVTRSTISSTLPDTLLYIVNFEDSSGYALVSATERIPGVVAYIEEGTLTPDDEIDNPGFLLFLDGYIKYYTHTSIMDIDPGTIIWRLIYHVTPLLTTNWGQGAPYNNYCYAENGAHAPAGCAAIAAGQIAAYHRYPASCLGHNYNWDAIMQYEQVPSSDTIASNSVAEFIHDIGTLVLMNYTPNSSSANFNNVANCWNSFGYHYLSDNSTADFDSVKTDISNGYPVYMRGTRYYYENGQYCYSGHAWVVDGVLIKGFPQMVLNNRPAMIYQNLIHCNWGWNGNCNGYFIIGAFETMYYVDNLNSTGGYASYNDYNYTYRHIYPNN
jgi:hypothetical protein